MVDEQPISYYDSNQKREVPKQEWMKQNEEPDYWERQTQISIAAEQRFKASIDSVSQRLNQTQGEWNIEVIHLHAALCSEFFLKQQMIKTVYKRPKIILTHICITCNPTAWLSDVPPSCA